MNEPLIRRINREQMLWRAVDVERLIEEDHAARAIWELVGRLDLSAFYEAIECSAEEGGRPAFDPRLLISVWIYAYSRGIGSAREVARRCEWEPGFEWLTGCEAVNYHTLASFRVEYRTELDELFTQVLGLVAGPPLRLAEPTHFVRATMNWMPHPWRFHGWAAMPMGSGDFADLKLRFLGLVD